MVGFDGGFDRWYWCLFEKEAWSRWWWGQRAAAWLLVVYMPLISSLQDFFFFLLVKWCCFVCLAAQNAVRCSLKRSPSVLVTIQPVGKGVISAGFNWSLCMWCPELLENWFETEVNSSLLSLVWEISAGERSRGWRQLADRVPLQREAGWKSRAVINCLCCQRVSSSPLAGLVCSCPELKSPLN